LERAEKDEPNSSSLESAATDGSKHNFTACCVAANVSRNCLGFCNLQNIIERNTGESVHNCATHLPEIFSCMAGQKFENSNTTVFVIMYLNLIGLLI
jgi:hypothetical protein